jgi:hypothetical protein
MDESEWLACVEPSRMMRHLRPKTRAPYYDHRSWFSGGRRGAQLPRRWRLVLAAYCRRIYPRLTSATARRLVEFAEPFAEASPGDRRPYAVLDEFPNAPSCAETSGVMRGLCDPLASAAGELRRVAGEAVRKATAERAARPAALSAAMNEEARSQCEMIRDVFGDPFRPVTLDRAWLTPTVASLAQAAYDERSLPSGELEPDRLTVLADALEEAGCTDDALLSHLRGPGPHVRGCWAVDLILGKV